MAVAGRKYLHETMLEYQDWIFPLFFNDVVECHCGIKINSELCNSIRMSQSLLRQLIYNLTAALQIILPIYFFFPLSDR